MKTKAPGEFLTWDSEFFTRRIARVTGTDLDDRKMSLLSAWCGENRIDCAYFLADPNSQTTLDSAQRNGFSLVDIRVELTLPVKDALNTLVPDATIEIREATAYDLSRLRELARQISAVSRFHRDSRFPNDLCEEMYAIWAEKNLKAPDVTVLVAEVSSEVRGFMSICEMPNGRATIPLVGVDSNAHRGGIGGHLVHAGVDFMKRRGIETASVVTQGANLAALKLYWRAGFFPSQVNMWFHKWFC